MKDKRWTTDQIKICQRYGAEYLPCAPESKVGIAAGTGSMNPPINGLHHPAVDDTSGWYLWSGTTLSDADDFFQPMHAKHLEEQCPEVIPFLGLPPGYRFLIDGDHVDVWYDASLLEA